MNTKAIYTVHENGKEHYFFSEHAGGFSYPFAVADFLHSLKGVLNDPMSPQKGLCVAPMLEQMKGNYLFPRGVISLTSLQVFFSTSSPYSRIFLIATVITSYNTFTGSKSNCILSCLGCHCLKVSSTQSFTATSVSYSACFA